MKLSDFIIPCAICGILCYGIYKKVNVFEVFVKGAKQGLSTGFSILPALVALMTCVGMFKASGALDVLSDALSPLVSLIHMPKEVIPLALLRPISGSGALVVFQEILKEHGPDSLIGRIASVMQGSTETTFYTIAVYYTAAKIYKTRYTLVCALSADIVGFLMSTICVFWFFYR